MQTMDLSSSYEMDIDETDSFDFQGLPVVIRNRIYKLLLCILIEPSSQSLNDPYSPSFFQPDIHPQILRTCRDIYYEGSFIMYRTNLLVKLQIELEPALIAARLVHIPYIPAKQLHLKNTKGFAMTHNIAHRDDSIRFPAMTLILLHRDLHQLLEALSIIRWKMLVHDERVEHTVTLIDPNPSAERHGSPPFFSREVQEQLVAPYVSSFKGYPNFKLNGMIPEDLKATITSAVTLMPEIYDPSQIEMFIQDKRFLHLLGNDFFEKGNLDAAHAQWTRCIIKIRDETNARVCKSGGITMMNELKLTYLALVSRIAQYSIQQMKGIHKDDPDERLMGAQNLRRTISDHSAWEQKFANECSCEIPIYGLATLRYRQSVAYRLTNDLSFYELALTCIDDAVRLMPKNVKILEEKGNVEVALAEARRM